MKFYKYILQVRTVKPGVYRHTITGLSPSTQYRVTVRAKHLRAGPPTGIQVEEAPGAYTDFRTLPKGLPDPPNEIMVRKVFIYLTLQLNGMR